MDSGERKIRMCCEIRFLGESCDSGSLFMFGGMWSFVSGERGFPAGGAGEQ